MAESIINRQSGLARTLIFIVLVVVSLTFLLPFFWQLAASLTTNADIDLVSRTFWPAPRGGSAGVAETGAAAAGDPVGPLAWLSDLRWENYVEAFEKVPLAKYFFNSLLVAGWVTVLQVLTSAMAAFAFSRIEWPGREKVFLLYLATMMIPGAVLLVPNFAIVLALGMYNAYSGLIIPAAFSAFGTFLLRQFMLTVPKSLDEAATLDGAGSWRLFWDVILPLCRPGLITLAIFAFIFNYSSFFWPLILIKDENLRTLPIGLLAFSDDYGTDIPLLMAASLLAMLPLVVLFVLLQKYLVRGIQLGAVKG